MPSADKIYFFKKNMPMDMIFKKEQI